MKNDKKPIFNFEECPAQDHKSNLRVARLFSFSMGFIVAIVLMFIATKN